MIYRGRIQNGVVVFDDLVTLPEGAAVRVEAVDTATSLANGPTGSATLAEQFAAFIGTVSDWPTDFAAQHDHYLHGTPKQ